MRLVLAASLLLLGSAAASAQAPEAVTRTPGQQYDVPAGAKPQTVIISRTEIAPGATGPLHIHPGVEMTYVAEGVLELWVGKEPPHVYHAKDSFIVPREQPHQAHNPGATPTILYVTLAVDKDRPSRIPLPGPALAH